MSTGTVAPAAGEQAPASWPQWVVLVLILFGVLFTTGGFLLLFGTADTDDWRWTMFLGSLLLPLGVLLGCLWGVFGIMRPYRPAPPEPTRLGRWVSRMPFVLLFGGGLVALVWGWVSDAPWSRWLCWAGLWAWVLGAVYGWWLTPPVQRGGGKRKKLPTTAKRKKRFPTVANLWPATQIPRPTETKYAGGSIVTRWVANNIEPLFVWLFAYPLFPLQIILLCWTSWGDFAGGLGAPDLIWGGNEWWMPFWAGVSISLLFGTVLFIRALLDRRPGHRPTNFGTWPSLFWFAKAAPTAAPRTDPLWSFRIAVCVVSGVIVAWLNYLTKGEFYWVWTTIFGVIVLVFALWGQVNAPPAHAHAPPAPSAEPNVVRELGAYLFYFWLAALAVFFVPKMFSPKWDPINGTWMLVGLLTGVALTVALVAVYEYWWRAWWYNSRLFRSLPAFQRGTIPESDRELHALAGLLTVLTPSFFLALFFYEHMFFEAIWSPVWLVCMFLSLFNALYGFVTFHYSGLQYVLLTLVVAVFFVSNEDRSYKMSLPGLDQYHPDRTPGAQRPNLDVKPTEPPPPLLETDALLARFEANWKQKHPGQKPKLVIVCTTGGGIQAAVWTAVVLEGLENDEKLKVHKFREHIRLMTGASGGMQGAALYAADFERENKDAYATLSRQLARDSLWPTVQTMLVHDFLGTFHLHRFENDRGRALEKAWARNCKPWYSKKEPCEPPNWFGESLGGYTVRTDPSLGGDELRAELSNPLGRTFGKLAEAEKECKRPVVVFSPMLVEDCRRVMISNLSVNWFTSTTMQHQNPKLEFQTDADATTISVPAIEFWRYFPKAHNTFAIGTAARLSATFPFVGPAVSLPTDPPRRVVDAGYFDNFGINFAAMWLHHHKKQILAHTSGVVIVEIRAYPRREEKLRFTPFGKNPREQDYNWGISEVWSPLAAVYNLYARSAYFRNDQLLHLLEKTFNAPPEEDDPTCGKLTWLLRLLERKLNAPSKSTDKQPFFTAVTFECDQPAALSWSLPNSKYEEIKQQFKALSAPPNNDGPVQRLRQWFGTGGK